LSAVLNNNWYDTGVSMSPRIHSCIHGITQYPIKATAPNTTMRDVKIEIITPFHFPTHCSSQLVRGSFIHEFLASYLIGLSGLGEPWLWSHPELCSWRSMCNIHLQSGHITSPTFLPESCLKPSMGPICSAIPFTVSLV
jgi:hypothetical protein